jgi:hypothetical protein
MPRSFADALAHRPLLFEPVPPTVRASPVRSGLQIEELVRQLRGVARLDAVNVPELVDENHDGRPYYRTGDVRGYARTLADQSGRDAIVNKVVAHLTSDAELALWVRGSVAAGLRHLVLVGGSSRYIPYPGPPVLEADRIAQALVGPAGGLLGNIAIPQRTGEASRMLAKTRAGAGFFTTQILFDAEATVRLLREYQERCRAASLVPAAVLLSFAPIADETDAEFVRWLGADIPESAEQAILNGSEGGAASRSVHRALEVWAGVRTARDAEAWTVPIGVNVEQISQRHLASAVEMLRAFAVRIDDAEAAPAGAGR